MNETRAAKARISAVAGRLSLVGTGLGALALVALGAQMLLDPPSSESASDATMRQTVTPVAAALYTPRAATAVAAVAAADAPQVWLSSLVMPDAPFATQDHAGDPVFPLRQAPRSQALPTPRVMVEAPTAPPPPAPHAEAEAPLVLARLTPQITLGAPRAVPPRRRQVASPQNETPLIAQSTPPEATTPDAEVLPADPVALAEMRAPRRSPLPRARPFTEAVAIAAAEPAPMAPEAATLLLASLGDGSGLLRSRTPQPRPEAVMRLASLSVDTPSLAPSSDAAPAAIQIPPLAANAGRGNCTSAMTRHIPRRARGAASGSAVIGRLTGAGGSDRDNAIISEVMQGNMPDFLRNLVPVSFTGTDSRGRPTQITICVTPDYLAVGSDNDFVRVPLGLPAAMRVAERFDMVMPTTRMVDAIYQQAQVRLSPSPMDPTSAMGSTNYFLRHNATVQGQMAQAGGRLGQLVSGHKKDLVLTNRLQSNPGRVAIYGWHRRNGQAIQPLSTVHGAQYADYSHGIRLVSRRAFVNGHEVDLRDLLSDNQVASLVSSEGTITNRQLLALAD